MKRRVRDVIQPGRDLGHVDGKKKSSMAPSNPEAENDTKQDAATASLTQLDIKSDQKAAGIQERDGVKRNADGSVCEDCN